MVARLMFTIRWFDKVANLTTDTQIKKAVKNSPPDTVVYFGIGGYSGLRLRIRGNYAEFQHRYTHPITKKRIEMTLGRYDKGFTLEHARQAHRDNLALLSQGIDPKTDRDNETTRQAFALKNTFKAVAIDWLNDQLKNPDHQPSKNTIREWQRHIDLLMNELGHYPIGDIKPPQLIKIFKDIQKTHIHKGNRVKSMANHIFAHAVALGILEHNPIADLKGAKILKTSKAKHRYALETPSEYAVLLREIDALPTGKLHQKEVLQLLALIFARIGDICAMKWADIDLNTKTWNFEPQKAKGKAAMMESLTLPLAPQAVAILERMHTLTGGMEYVFYTGRNATEPYTDPQQLNKLLNNPSMNKLGIGKEFCNRGYKDVHCPHGFRASAKTMLMERLGYDELITELQLGHKMLNKYGRAYSRMDMLKQRTDMAIHWANYLDDLKAGKVDNVIYLDNIKAQKAING